jgi:hypothetical protein
LNNAIIADIAYWIRFILPNFLEYQKSFLLVLQ